MVGEMTTIKKILVECIKDDKVLMQNVVQEYTKCCLYHIGYITCAIVCIPRINKSYALFMEGFILSYFRFLVPKNISITSTSISHPE